MCFKTYLKEKVTLSTKLWPIWFRNLAANRNFPLEMGTHLLRAALFTFTGAVSFRFRLLPPTTGFPKVMGLIIIGETVACTLRVIFCGDFKVPKKPEKKVRLVHFWEARRRQG